MNFAEAMGIGSLNNYQSGGGKMMNNIGVGVLVVIAIVVIVVALGNCGVIKFPLGFEPNSDIYGRSDGSGTPLDFPIIRPEGYSPGTAAPWNKCQAHRTNGPIAANACYRRGAPVSGGNRQTRLITDTPSGCDCTCMCPSEPGDALGVIKRITPADLNVPYGAASAVVDAENAANVAKNAAANAAGEVANAEMTGNSNSQAKRKAAEAANAAEKAMNAANKAKNAVANGKLVDAEKAANVAVSAANKANKAKNAVSNSLGNANAPISEMTELSNVMKGSGNAKPANAKSLVSKNVSVINGNKIEPYKKGKGSKSVPIY